MAGFKNPPYRPDTRFRPGQSGNPRGRPKRLPELESLLVRVLNEKVKDHKGKRITLMEGIIRSIAMAAVRGDMRAAEMINNRAYGMPKQTTEMTVIPMPPPIIAVMSQEEIKKLTSGGHGE